MELNSIIETTNEYFDDYFSYINSFNELRLEEIESDDCNSSGLYSKTSEYMGDQNSEIEKIVQLTYASFILSVSVFLEARFIDLCINLENKNEQIFSHKDLKGIGSTRAINYISKVLSIKFPVNDIIRNNFNVFWEVRNSLIHSEGIIKEDKVSLVKRFIVENPDILSINSNNKIKLTKEYALFVLNLNKDICSEILSLY